MTVLGLRSEPGHAHADDERSSGSGGKKRLAHGGILPADPTSVDPDRLIGAPSLLRRPSPRCTIERPVGAAPSYGRRAEEDALGSVPQNPQGWSGP